MLALTKRWKTAHTERPGDLVRRANVKGPDPFFRKRSTDDVDEFAEADCWPVDDYETLVRVLGFIKFSHPTLELFLRGTHTFFPSDTPSLLRPILAKGSRDKLPRARLVVTVDGTTPGRTYVLRKFKALQRRLGLPGWSFHSLRHSFISELVRAGASIEAVRLLAGHSKLDVTARYAHATGADLSRAIEALRS